MVELSADNILEYLANTPQITFEITERCNLSCIYCGYGKLYANRGERKNRDLPIAKAIRFLEYLKNLWVLGNDTQGDSYITISFYGGEPLLNIEFIKRIIAYIESNLCGYKKKFIYSMTTNAILLSKYIDYLVEKGFKLLISLDGDDKGSSLRIFHNGTPAFNKIISEIDYVAHKYPKYFDTNVEFNSVLSTKTTVEEIIDFIEQRYGKKPTISEINPEGVNPKEKYLFESIHRKKWLGTAITKVQNKNSYDFLTHPYFERAARYILMHSPYVYMDYNELLFNNQNRRKELPTGTCFPFVKKVFITVSGQIMPCERISYTYALGTVYENAVSIDFKAIAERYNKYYNRVRPVCQKCANNEGCLSCMFSNGQLESPHSMCSYFMSSKDAKNMKNEIGQFLHNYPEAYSYIMNNYEVII